MLIIRLVTNSRIPTRQEPYSRGKAAANYSFSQDRGDILRFSTSRAELIYLLLPPLERCQNLFNFPTTWPLPRWRTALGASVPTSARCCRLYTFRASRFRSGRFAPASRRDFSFYPQLCRSCVRYIYYVCIYHSQNDKNLACQPGFGVWYMLVLLVFRFW